ncbi:hypothetical protein EHP00_584 [Ecytonucleospora hepatopenaei]|uniref:Uncharacterized protein n=1 Tax=Ecytonucleospora hepatopenaei TaxID=646526 RepID=A0A1W0E3P8_9MICR|nr:hypothetical protein EHP00_584 [Ecytonucleospora hepatopenaei]
MEIRYNGYLDEIDDIKKENDGFKETADRLKIEIDGEIKNLNSLEKLLLKQMEEDRKMKEELDAFAKSRQNKNR